jgi:hypothetical protein
MASKKKEYLRKEYIKQFRPDEYPIVVYEEIQAIKPFRARHGDVIIIPTNDEIEGDVEKHLTLAEGEVTGHSHRIIDGDAALFKFNNKMYLKVQSKIATLVHEEHKALQIPQGEYEIIIQQDYEPSGWTRVQD